ncbi:MAG: FAD-dependent oxidoreductase, partial [Alphaproteobacteria bacterium]
MHDVVIVGGGLHGCSTAYHLLRREPTLRVAV